MARVTLPAGKATDIHGLRNAGAEPAEVLLSCSSSAREFKLA